ncbi:protoheme IX farnesyltransferase, mitochondrial-like [Diadema antillarum]|uniref:protoheme IX farnesyltransferase, mitochondrial-like n=1 Tax=Diadema antillarum TaxID=105358 RepID=UPI003A8997D6
MKHLCSFKHQQKWLLPCVSPCFIQVQKKLSTTTTHSQRHQPHHETTTRTDHHVEELSAPLEPSDILSSGLNERVEKAIQSAVDQVAPCPIEPKDGNKVDEEVIVQEIRWREQSVALSELPSIYMELSKSRLTGLVVISALAGYGMAPGVFDPATCALMGLGTFLASCSANTVNQFCEVPYDSQMARTRNRVLVRGLISPLHAMSFASFVGVSGVAILGGLVNPLSAAIAGSSWALYVLAYTPLKRLSIMNTWVGAVVGALPPAIGWAASCGTLGPGALLMAGYLYCWQFPHFNALSWNLRSDYSRGGYCMMATTDPGLCRRVALRHCLGMIALSTLAPVFDLTTWTFALDSLPLNLWLTYLGWKFYKNADSKSARQLFKCTLLHLPLLMLLLLISKKDLYDKDKRPALPEGALVAS